MELAAVASRHGGLDGVPWYSSLEALLAQELSIDSLAICSPPLRRQQEAALALQAGRHVLLERPPAATLSQIALLLDSARRTGLTLMAAWPARMTAAVETARGLLLRSPLETGRLVWTEDSRAWFAEKDWIWSAGGLGVFHVAVDALSVVNRVVEEHLAVVAATLHMTPDRPVPVAADITLRGESGLTIEAAFDVRPGVRERRTFEMQTRAGPISLDEGGSTLRRDGRIVPVDPAFPYRSTYQKFMTLVGSGGCDVDVAPLRQVADAHLIGERVWVNAIAAS